MKSNEPHSPSPSPVPVFRNKVLIAKKLSSEFMSIFGFSLHPFVSIIGLDICSLDDKFANKDPEYDNENCTYKDKTEIGMESYVRIKYGERAVKILQELL